MSDKQDPPTEEEDLSSLTDSAASPDGFVEDPSNSPTTEAPGPSEPQREMTEEEKTKMMQEMMTSLKGVGNMFLKPFGLSTDNFEVVEQPGGGYTIQVKK